MVNAGARKLNSYRHTKQAVFARKLCRDGTAPLTVPRKVTHAALADALGVSKPYLSAIERGERTPGLRLALKMQEFGVADPEDWDEPATEQAA